MAMSDGDYGHDEVGDDDYNQFYGGLEDGQVSATSLSATQQPPRIAEGHQVSGPSSVAQQLPRIAVMGEEGLEGPQGGQVGQASATLSAAQQPPGIAEGRQVSGPSSVAQQLPNEQPPVVTNVSYTQMLNYCKLLCTAVSGTPNSVCATGIILQLTRLAQNGGITEGTSQEVVRDAANLFSTSTKKRKKIDLSSRDNDISPMVGSLPAAGRPLGHRLRDGTEPPAPARKRNPHCNFCGSTKRTAGNHCRIKHCPQVKAIGTLLVGTKTSFADALLNGSYTCDILSAEDRSRLEVNVFTSLPKNGKYISVHRHFTVSQALAPECLYQVTNRAAEVTVYGDGGVALEGYNRVAATVTAVSVWINKNSIDNVISALKESQQRSV
jgi:hypothetical protein